MTGPARPSATVVNKEVGRLAIRVEGLLSRLRTDAVLRPRWFRPAWQAGREEGLREAHDAVQQMLNERGLPHFGPIQATVDEMADDNCQVCGESHPDELRHQWPCSVPGLGLCAHHYCKPARNDQEPGR